MTRRRLSRLLLVLAAWPAAVHGQTARPTPAASPEVSPRLPLTPLRTVALTTDEGTWMALDVAPDGRTIAFELLGNIFTVPITGRAARQLTEGPGWHERPRYAPDGRSLFFTSDRGGYNQLWQMPVTGGTPTLVPGDTVAGYRLAPEVDFSPEADSAEVAAVYRAPGGRYEIRHRSTKPEGADLYSACEGREFVLTDRNTGTERVLAPGGDCGGDRLPASAFTPDGRAFISAFGGKLRRIAVPSGETRVIPFRATVRLPLRPLTRFPIRVPEDSLVQARRLAGAALSPDGARVAFSAFGRLWVASLADRVPRRLTTLSTGEFWPAWSPDGQYVAFVTWTDAGGGEGAIYRVRADGRGAPERLTRESGAYTGLAYSSDGTHVYAIRHSLEAMRRFDYWGPMRAAETVAVPATGGVVRPWTDGFWQGEASTLAGLHVLPGVREQIARFAGRGEAEANGKPREAGAVVVRARGAPEDTAVKVVFPAFQPKPPRYLDYRTVTDVVLSPRRDRALVVTKGHTLYLVDVPPKQGAAPPTVLFDAVLPGVHLVTPLARGAEFPQWRRNGRQFTYVFGTTVYTVDVPARGAPSNPQAVALDVTQPRDLPRGTLALRQARLITLRGNEVIERGDIVIRDRRIVALGPTGRVPIPADAHVVDLSGKTVIPGLIDGHNHVFLPPALPHSRVWAYEANLGYGVLTSRDPQAEFTTVLSYEDQLATGELLGPRYMNTGTGIGTSSGDDIRSLEEAREVVARYAEVYRVRNIKEYGLTRRDARQWLIMAAAERRMNVVSHGGGHLKQMLQNAVDGYAGYDHLWVQAPLYDDLQQLLALSGLTLGNMLWNNWDDLNVFVPQFSDAEWAKVDRLFSPDFLEGHYFRDRRERRPVRNRVIERSLAQVVAEGGRVMIGAHGNAPGFATHVELWGLAAGGMPLLEVLRAGTLRGAEALGMDQDLGSLEVGKLGDVLILDQNPLEHIRHTNTIRFIVFNGRLRDALTLDELWPQRRPLPPMWWAAQPEH